MVGENFFYNPYYVSNDEIHIMRTYFVKSGSYGWMFWAIFLNHNTYTSSRRVKRDNYTPINVPILENYINFHYKRYSFNAIPQILSKKNINDLAMKVSIAPRIFYPTIYIFV